MPDVQLPKLEIPPNATATNEPVIFSMPEKYRGLTARVNPPLVKPANVPTPTVETPKPPPLPPPKPVPTLIKKKGMTRSTKVLIVSGIAVVLVLAAAAIYVLVALKPVDNATNQIPKNNTNTNKVNTAPANTNQNTNTVKPPANTNKPSNTTVTSPFPEGLQPGRDTDSDGLTDAEEILFHTNSKLPDSDSDGFLDGNEVFHGYDPNLPSPAKLSDSSIVVQYMSLDKTFFLNHPAIWTQKVSEDSKGLVLVAPTGEIFSVTSQTKDANVVLSAWFSGANPNAETKVVEGKTKKSYTMLTTDDQMTVYIDAGTSVIILDYQNTMKATVEFLRTFSMMVNSLTLVAAQP